MYPENLFPKRTGWMTVGDMKKLIQDLPEDMIIVQGGSDHSYNLLGRRQVEQVDAEYFKKGSYFGESYENELSKDVVVIPVLLIGD